MRVVEKAKFMSMWACLLAMPPKLALRMAAIFVATRFHNDVRKRLFKHMLLLFAEILHANLFCDLKCFLISTSFAEQSEPIDLLLRCKASIQRSLVPKGCWHRERLHGDCSLHCFRQTTYSIAPHPGIMLPESFQLLYENITTTLLAAIVQQLHLVAPFALIHIGPILRRECRRFYANCCCAQVLRAETAQGAVSPPWAALHCHRTKDCCRIVCLLGKTTPFGWRLRSIRCHRRTRRRST